VRAEHIDGGGAGKREIAELAGLIAGSTRIVALTGAGISTESGIPDFRSPGGIWSRMRPITYQDFVASEEARLEDWSRRFRMSEDFARAEPNAGHVWLADLAREGRLLGLVTQNIDGLHRRSGVPAEKLVEIHGNVSEGRCLDCRAPMSLGEARRVIEATGASPRCACGGLVKAAIVSFGERMPEEAMRRALDLAGAADLFLAIGTSLQVQPAALLPLAATRSGATLVIINRDPTPLDPEADLLVHAAIGEVAVALRPQLVN
jgi:NAD-dependent deacetylase